MKPHEHMWQKVEELSTFNCHRFRCITCAAFGVEVMGYRMPFAQSVIGRQIREYKGKVPESAKRVEVTAKPRSVGNNATGGYLPPGGTTRGRR